MISNNLKTDTIIELSNFFKNFIILLEWTIKNINVLLNHFLVKYIKF